jgi:hypothetical protein
VFLQPAGLGRYLPALQWQHLSEEQQLPGSAKSPSGPMHV